jgi:hypothetical protein
VAGIVDRRLEVKKVHCSEKASIPDGSLYSRAGEIGLPYGLVIHGASHTGRGESLPSTLIVPDVDSRTLLVWEHSDLLKLKAAVEKALEVTPKSERYELAPAEPPTGFTVRTGRMRLPVHFTDRHLAEEYVAWKNSQETK